jgi:hypothetical protein
VQTLLAQSPPPEMAWPFVNLCTAHCFGLRPQLSATLKYAFVASLKLLWFLMLKSGP